MEFGIRRHSMNVVSNDPDFLCLSVVFSQERLASSVRASAALVRGVHLEVPEEYSKR